MLIELEPIAMNIDEVVVLPGINPAHRIIDSAIINKNINNPEKIISFSYDSYNKMIFTFNIDERPPDSIKVPVKDTIPNDTATVDSTYIRAKRFIDRQHMFIMESASHRDFVFPDKSSEKVLASRVSGFKNPTFVLLATQLQSFSFYDEYISLFDKRYLSPLADKSTNKYLFLIEDTTITKQNDTVFTLSFRPRKGKNFEGVSGVVSINTNKYAVQSIKAEPYVQSKDISLRIQQNYKFVDNKQWFPFQLNTDITFNNMTAKVAKDRYEPMVGIGKSYIKNIKIEPELDTVKFSNIALEVDEKAHEKDSAFWAEYRVVPLSDKDLNTYKKIDSIGEAENFDLKFKIFETLARGAIPVGPFDIDYTKILHIDEYQGFRFGAGIYTNEKISKRFSLGGYGAYSIKDDAYKYGGSFRLFFDKKRVNTLKLFYASDVHESDELYMFDDKASIIGTELIRKYYIEQMDSIESYGGKFTFRAFNYFKFSLGYSENKRIITNLNRYSDIHDLTAYKSYQFKKSEFHVKFAYKEKFMEMPSGRFSLGTNYPIFRLSLSNNKIVNNYYNKIQFSVDKKFHIKNVGESSFRLNTGIVFGETPLGEYFNGHGSFYKDFPAAADFSFGTMRMNEFLSNQYAYLFFKHDFKKLLFRTKKFEPEIAILFNYGIGALDKTEKQLLENVKDMSKGFYESGILLNNLIKSGISGLGIACYYRMGDYGYEKPIDNFALKLSLSIML